LADALVDPWLGRLSDRLFARSTTSVVTVAVVVASVLCLAFVGLFFPPEALQLNSQTLLIWLTVLLTLSHGAYSALGIMHQSWIAMLGGSTLQRSRLVSWREGLGLIGVLLASALPSVIGMAGYGRFDGRDPGSGFVGLGARCEAQAVTDRGAACLGFALAVCGL
jgi:Na+/melibiose symporter-like transporter